MRIGLLTLHDSINYGAVLQAYALSRVYAALGHRAVLVDRRRSPQGWPLKWELSALSPWMRAMWFLNATGTVCEWRRRRRTLAFLRTRIGLTPYHFGPWRDAPAGLGVDALSVGSDQVWNATIHDPLDYVKPRIPPDVPTLSYAASLGMRGFPEALRRPMAEGLKAFLAVSVREENAVAALAELGIRAAHVVDPVVLAGRPVWDGLLGGAPAAVAGRVVVYLLGVYLPPCIGELAAWAARTGRTVDFFVGRFVLEPLSRRGHPRLFRNLRQWRRYRRLPNFRLHLDDGPEDFVRAIAGAEAVITSSYHALLFATVYARDVRFVVPDAATPQAGMMVRIRDYAGSVVGGPLLQPSLSAACASLDAGERVTFDGEALERRRQASLDWLGRALERLRAEGAE